jgi:hypothetical protein
MGDAPVAVGAAEAKDPVADESEPYAELPVYVGDDVVAQAKVPVDLYDALAKKKWERRADGHVLFNNFKKLAREVMPVRRHERVEHVNGDLLDHRRGALRVVGLAEYNQRKRKRDVRPMTSRHRGVSWHKKARKFAAVYSRTRLGWYASEDDAARAYNAHVSKLYPHAALNDVPNTEVEAKPYEKRERGLPTGITLTVGWGGERWSAKFRGGCLGTFSTLEEAVEARDEARNAASSAKVEAVRALQITRNRDGAAVIEAKCGTEVIVDEGKWHNLMMTPWYITNKGYARANKLGLMSRYLMGVTDPHAPVDHINRNPLDNRVDNLRIAAVAGNAFNMRNRKKRKNATTAYVGVSLVRKTGKYLAAIVILGAYHRLGYYETPEQAAWVYDSKCAEVHGPGCTVNGVDAPAGWTFRDDHGCGPDSPCGHTHDSVDTGPFAEARRRLESARAAAIAYARLTRARARAIAAASGRSRSGNRGRRRASARTSRRKADAAAKSADRERDRGRPAGRASAARSSSPAIARAPASVTDAGTAHPISPCRPTATPTEGFQARFLAAHRARRGIPPTTADPSGKAATADGASADADPAHLPACAFDFSATSAAFESARGRLFAARAMAMRPTGRSADVDRADVDPACAFDFSATSAEFEAARERLTLAKAAALLAA